MQLKRKGTRSALENATRHESGNRHRLPPGNGLQLILVQQSGFVQVTLFWKQAAEHRQQAYRQHAEHGSCGMQRCPAAVTV